MSRAEAEQPDPSAAKAEPESVQEPEATSGKTEPVEPANDADNSALEATMTPERLSVQLERFSSLSSEMAELLSGLAQEVKRASDQLQNARSEVDIKKQELETLNRSSDALKHSIEDYRVQKESLERFVASQRMAWEEERAARARQEEEYQESLKIHRQHVEEEHRQKLAAEYSRAQQQLEEERKAIHEGDLEKQQAFERDCLEREQRLREKEMEWIRLIQELEQFMVTLAKHTQARAAEPANPGRRDPDKLQSSAASDFSGLHEKDPSRASKNSGNVPMAEGPSEAKSPPLDPVLGDASVEEPKPSISSLREMLLSQERRIENLNAEPSAKRGSSPLKFPSPAPPNFKPDS